LFSLELWLILTRILLLYVGGFSQICAVFTPTYTSRFQAEQSINFGQHRSSSVAVVIFFTPQPPQPAAVTDWRPCVQQEERRSVIARWDSDRL